MLAATSDASLTFNPFGQLRLGWRKVIGVFGLHRRWHCSLPAGERPLVGFGPKYLKVASEPSIVGLSRDEARRERYGGITHGWPEKSDKAICDTRPTHLDKLYHMVNFYID